MTLRTLPEMTAARLPDTFAFTHDDEALQRWQAGVRAEQTPENTISILDVIGEDFWTGGGVTSKRVAAALRQIGDTEVFVDINSPGGDFFEGVAIFNQLRLHKHKVTVRILGLAASAASLISMSGDEIQIGKAGFMMVHNAWVLAVGNRHDMRAAADTLEPFDDAMATVYSERAGVEKKAAVRWMDDEQWFNGEQAVEAGLADDFLTADTAIDATAAAAHEDINALRRADALFARAGLTRSQSRSLLGEIKGGTQDAAPNATQDAGDWTAAAAQLIATLKT
ncbi:MAG: Clp protease ClpP [Rhodobacter sp.]|nr:Clp protease ClpP [Rhodobacter sp.]